MESAIREHRAIIELHPAAGVARSYWVGRCSCGWRSAHWVSRRAAKEQVEDDHPRARILAVQRELVPA